jgi:hypothetical protein
MVAPGVAEAPGTVAPDRGPEVPISAFATGRPRDGPAYRRPAAGSKVPASGSVGRREHGTYPPSVGAVPLADSGKFLVLRTAVLLVIALVVTAVGLVDVVRDGNSDLTLLFIGLLLLQAAALVTAALGHRGVRLRPDLTAWLTRQAAATGEPIERLADRCVAAYRAGLTDDRPAIP